MYSDPEAYSDDSQMTIIMFSYSNKLTTFSSSSSSFTGEFLVVQILLFIHYRTQLAAMGISKTK